MWKCFKIHFVSNKRAREKQRRKDIRRRMKTVRREEEMLIVMH